MRQDDNLLTKMLFSPWVWVALGFIVFSGITYVVGLLPDGARANLCGTIAFLAFIGFVAEVWHLWRSSSSK